VAEVRQLDLVSGLRIEVQEVYGRTGLVAWNESLGDRGC
jgi:hypothetical protein